MAKLDKIDAKILDVIQRDIRLTTDELGRHVNLSPTACQRRLKRLRAEGFIESEVAILSPKALGQAVTMVVLVSLECERADIVDRFRAAALKTREVMTCFYATGDADFVLVITAKSMDEYEQFSRRFFRENPDIKGFKTMVVMDRVKAGFQLPIDPEDPIYGGSGE